MTKTEINAEECLAELRSFLYHFPCIEMECTDSVRVLIVDVAELYISYLTKYGFITQEEFISLGESVCFDANIIYKEMSTLRETKSFLTIDDENIVQQLLDIVNC